MFSNEEQYCEVIYLASSNTPANSIEQAYYSICLFSFQLSHQRTLIPCRGATTQ